MTAGKPLFKGPVAPSRRSKKDKLGLRMERDRLLHEVERLRGLLDGNRAELKKRATTIISLECEVEAFKLGAGARADYWRACATLSPKDTAALAIAMPLEPKPETEQQSGNSRERPAPIKGDDNG